MLDTAGLGLGLVLTTTPTRAPGLGPDVMQNGAFSAGVEQVISIQDVVDATSVNQFKNRLDKFCRRYGH